jgi:hypothetical protein
MNSRRPGFFRVATNLAQTHNSSHKLQAGSISAINALPDDAPGASEVMREVYGLGVAEVRAALGLTTDILSAWRVRCGRRSIGRSTNYIASTRAARSRPPRHDRSAISAGER